MAINEKDLTTTKKTRKPVAKKEETISLGTQETVVTPTEKVVRLRLDVPPTDKPFQVQLGQIISIDKTDIPDAKLAVRNLNRDNLNSLILADPEKVPPIKVQMATFDGNSVAVCYDGLHRASRGIALARLDYNKFADREDKEVDEIEFLDSLPLPGLDETAFINGQTIWCEAANFKTSLQLMQAAFVANKDHGLTSSKETRTKHAVWLLTNKLAKNKREAGRMAGCTHVAIIHYMNAKVRAKSEDEMSASEKAEKTQKDKDNAYKGFARALRTVYAALNECDIEMSEATANLAEYLKDSEHEMVADIAGVLEELSQELAEAYEENAANEETDDDE